MKNIGILAHVDAGKTTITENFLFLSDSIKTLGSVNQGSSVSDSMRIEKERGISIRSASLSFTWQDVVINLIDTPGHADFSSEVERALAVLDGVILVISAVEGIQAHTYTLWEGIKKSGIPSIFFINKIDRAGSDFQNAIDQIKKEFQATVIPIYIPGEEGNADASILSVFEDETLSSSQSVYREMAMETLAENDDTILNQYLEGEKISLENISQKISQLSREQLINPVYCGIAKYGIGMEQLLNGVIDMFPDAPNNIKEEMGALVFKMEHHKTLGKLAHIRVFSGTIQSRDQVMNHTRQRLEKISQVKKIFAVKMVDLDILNAGDIGVITGLQSVQAGDLLGNVDKVPKLQSLQKPVITVQVKASNDIQYADLAQALLLLNSEDPSLGFKWFKDIRELHLNLMGTIQIEVLESLLGERFGIKTEFSPPTVIYKEIPADTGEGIVEYTMPKPCWAVMHFKIEPNKEGSGINYNSQVSVNDIHRKYQNEIESTVSKALEQGLKGWEVTDIKITLLAGEDHDIHSRPGDFILATPMGILKALEKAGTDLLEPVYKFDIRAPEIFLGDIVSDLNKMRGTFDSPEFENGYVKMTGILPVATSLQYHIRFSSSTAGKGSMRKHFNGYRRCPDDYGKTREFKGVSPLNASQWILHNRGAYKANERN